MESSRSSSSSFASMVTMIPIASNTEVKNSAAFSSMDSTFFARMTAGLAPINPPRSPALPFSTTSYWILSLLTPSCIDACVIASSTVFAVTVIISIIDPPLIICAFHELHCISVPWPPWPRCCPAWRRYYKAY